jgi:N-acylneuraminate cytidylyltransferase
MTINLCVIFARGGSKGFADKNLSKINGQSLIGRSIQHGLSFPNVSEVIISTDSSEIAEEAEKHGGKIYFTRPHELATDLSREIESWKHSINFMENKFGVRYDNFLTFPVTSPLRNADDILQASNMFFNSNIDILISGCLARKNPYFNMFEKNIGN